MYTSKAEIAEKILTASGVPGVSKLFQIDLALLDVRLVIDVSVNIFLGFLYKFFYFQCVSEFNQMYEILG